MSNDGVATIRDSWPLVREKRDGADTSSALAGCYSIVPERLEHSELNWLLKRLIEKEGGTLVVGRGNGARDRITQYLMEPD